jgi:putative DNA primase/helicase
MFNDESQKPNIINGLVASEPRLCVISLEEFLTLELPPQESILSPWLSTQGLALIYAPRGIGKTHVALGIAHAVASGSDFLRWKAPKPRGVLYIDGEMPANMMQERLTKIVAASDVPVKAPFKILTPDLQPNWVCQIYQLIKVNKM